MCTPLYYNITTYLQVLIDGQPTYLIDYNGGFVLPYSIDNTLPTLFHLTPPSKTLFVEDAQNSPQEIKTGDSVNIYEPKTSSYVGIDANGWLVISPKITPAEFIVAKASESEACANSFRLYTKAMAPLRIGTNLGVAQLTTNQSAPIIVSEMQYSTDPLPLQPIITPSKKLLPPNRKPLPPPTPGTPSVPLQPPKPPSLKPLPPPSTPSTPLQPPATPLKPPSKLTEYLLIALGVLLIISLILFVVRRRMKK